MREIEFRAWDIDNEEMHYIGSLLTILAQPSLPKRILEAANFMQYTGLTDKNGKEIYEGDIVVSNYSEITNCEVYFKNGSFKFKDNRGEISLKSLVDERTEVIGNIYENPELLKNA